MYSASRILVFQDEKKIKEENFVSYMYMYMYSEISN